MQHNCKKLFLVIFTFSVVITICNGAVLFPKALVTQSGTASPVPLSALSVKDQRGSQDNWNRYVELYGSSSQYKGVFTFDVSSLNAESVSSFSLDVNFKGPKMWYQRWTFEFFVPASNQWVLAGNNEDANNWVWTELSFPSTTRFSSLVSGGSVQLRLTSSGANDDCDLDYLAITTSESGAATSAPTSAPTPKATAAPTQQPTNAPTPKATTAPTSPATAAPTTAPTPKATTAPTQAPTPKATTAPTQAPTPKATTAPTQAPTPKATTAPTQAPTPKATTAPTQAPTPKATTAPTQAPTPKATTAPTQAPTPKATTAPTTAPSTGGRLCPAGQIWSPAPGTTWQWQLTGTIDQTWDVQMYDIDLFDATAAVISSLHSKGRAVICYFSTQYEDWRPDASKFTSDVLGNNLDDWPGERYADIRSAKVRQIMSERMDLAVTKGCDGVEPDNVDGYANNNGLGLTAANQLEYNKYLAQQAHARGLSIGLKNDLDQVGALVSSFDWALNEQCNQYGECGTLDPFVAAGKAVFGVDYSGSAGTICPAMVNKKFSWLMKDLSLGAKGTQCCTYASGGCATKPAYKCVTY
jgi:hypothetical protein